MNVNKVFKVTFLAVGFMLLCFSYSFASLSILTLQPVVTDTASALSIEWRWFQGEGPAASTYNGKNWQANLSIIPFFMNNESLDATIWGFQHLIGPHGEDKDPAPFFSTGDIAIGPTGIITQSGDWPHPTATGAAHNDHWTFTFDRGTGLADLSVTHTPIPPSLLLLTSGLLGLFGIGRKKLFLRR